MGSSTTTVQSVNDYVSSMGELSPVLPTGGYSTNTALGIATDVMLDLIAQRFNWKWNRERIPPFYTNSWQQDYAQIGSRFPAPIGWLEAAYWIDINNTALPKPTYPIEVVRDLPFTSISGNPPGKICWLPNSQLTQGIWPGAGKVYTPPLGATITPTNPPTNILDAYQNILVLTTFGTTGLTEPLASTPTPLNVTHLQGFVVSTPGGNIYFALVTFDGPTPAYQPGESCLFAGLTVAVALNGQTLQEISPSALPIGVPVPAANQAVFSVGFSFQMNTDDSGVGTFNVPLAHAPEGMTVSDGSCVWTVADPDSQGFRIIPLPPQQGVVYQVNVIAQRRAPLAFTKMSQTIDPIPDDYAHHFRTGYIAGCYKMSPNAQMRALYYGPRGLHENWLASMFDAAKQGDREPDNAGFIPDRSVVAAQGGIDIGPANPYLYNVWPGR